MNCPRERLPGKARWGTVRPCVLVRWALISRTTLTLRSSTHDCPRPSLTPIPDGEAGAIAIAVATATAWQMRSSKDDTPRVDSRSPQTHATWPNATGDKQSSGDPRFVNRSGPRSRLLVTAARVIASDTVPFCLWCAARHLRSFEQAMWSTVSGRGDRDTTCAIVGAIVALSVGSDKLPSDWLEAQ